MAKRIDLTPTLAALRSASVMTEEAFLRVGLALESSTNILADLAASFEAALLELKDEKVGNAIRSLVSAASQITGFGAAQSAASIRFADMQRAAESIAERITKMKGSVKSVDALAINSKIAAAGIRGSSIDFTSFSDEIARTLKMTLASLDSFDAELQTVRAQVAKACAGQLVFEQSHHESTQSVPKQLSASIGSMPSQHKRNAKGIAALERRSERVGKQVNAAVTALQAGDILRQRLEHIDQGLGFLAQMHELSEADQRTFAITTCVLQGAQLAATAEEFERNVSRITRSLNTVASEARMMRGLADSTYGSSGSGKSRFIGNLEAQVSAALALFEGYGTAHADAEQTMTSASASAEGLCTHLRVVQSLEDDIRIMGLNTTLQCARVGPEGRALGLIAQELRSYGNQFAREAGALISEVESLVTMAATFAAVEPDIAATVATVVEAMQGALLTLRQAGQTIDGAMATLEQDSERVASLLEAAIGYLVANDGIGEALRQAAAELQAVTPLDDRPTDFDVAPLAQQMLDQMARTYTMATERAIHDQIIGGSISDAVSRVVAANSELEDMLF